MVQGLVRRVAAVGAWAVACGDGFVQATDPTSGQAAPSLAIDGLCAGAAVLDSRRLAVAERSGTISVLDVSDDGTLSIADSLASGHVLHGIASDGEDVVVAAGAAGVERYAIEAGVLSPRGGLAGAVDARDVALVPGAVLVADGTAGLKLIDLEAGVVLAELETEGVALGVRTDGDRVAVLRGGYGWDLVTLAGDTVMLDATVATEGLVLDAVFVDGEVFTAEAHAIVRRDVTGPQPSVVAIEHRERFASLDGAWFGAISRFGDGLVAGEGESLVPVLLEPNAAAPIIAVVDRPSMSFWAQPGDTAEGIYVVKNAGQSDLVIRGVETAGPFSLSLDTTSLDEVENCPGQYWVPPDGSALINVEFTPDSGDLVSEGFTVLSDDPDRPRLTLALEGNRPGPELGAEAPDFGLRTLGGDRLQLSDQRGKVVFLKLFNFACATCSEEMPAIDGELIPSYDPADFIAVGINSSHKTAFAASIALEHDLGLPIALDPDSEVFRSYRVPSEVFPLHIVLDREGRVAHVNNDPGIDAVREAIDAAL